MFDISTVTVVVSVAIGVATGALVALKAVAPHTKTQLDDKIVAKGEQYMPYAVRLLEWLRGRK